MSVSGSLFMTVPEWKQPAGPGQGSGWSGWINRHIHTGNSQPWKGCMCVDCSNTEEHWAEWKGQSQRVTCGVLPFIEYATSDKIKERQNRPVFARGEVWRRILLGVFFFSFLWKTTRGWLCGDQSVLWPDCGDQHPNLYVWWNSKIPHTLTDCLCKNHQI